MFAERYYGRKILFRLVLFQRRALMFLGTASMCISMFLVGLSWSSFLGRQPESYFNKERRCPFWTASICISNSLIYVLGLHLRVLVLGNPSGIRVVDRRLSYDGNMWGKVECNQYGRSFTRS